MNQQYNIKTPQQGAALIAVLIILVVITLLGITAMRMSLSSLSLATNSQVSLLLFQSADFGTRQIVGDISSNARAALDTTGRFADASGREIAFCLYPTANGNSFGDGVCNLNNNNGYVSSRNIVTDVVTVARVQQGGLDASEKTKDLSQEGSGDANLGGGEILRVHSTAVMPSFGSASIDDIVTCLNKPSDDEASDSLNQYTKTDCLTDKGAVFTTQVALYKTSR